MTTVLIVNDQPMQRLGLRMLLAAEPGLTVVGEAAGGAEAIRTSAELRPDVVLMDSRIPDRDGLDTLRRIARPDTHASALTAGRSPRVLVLSTTGLEEHAFTALRAGAAGFLLMDAVPEELITAVHAVAAGDAALSPGLTLRLVDTVRLQRPAFTPEPERRLDTLTGRERDVLTGVASGWSNAEIAERLSIAPTTVKSHVSNLLGKIGARARVQAVVFAYESGLVRPS